MRPAKRSLILCADDFALDEAVSEGVLRLVAARRVSAVSCFTDAPLWSEAGAELRGRAGHEIALGLHFNLTEGFGAGERPLGYWLAASLLRVLDARAIGSRLRRQIERFREVAGRPPDFIDGHQHEHALPVIRYAVAAVAAEAGSRPIPLRDVRRFFGPTDAPFKRFVISRLARAGANPLGREDRSAPVAGREAGADGATDPARAVYLNAAMSGDYSLSADADYRGLFAAWLAAAPERGLVMCHPAAALTTAHSGAPAKAPHRGASNRELAFLESDEFSELLAEHEIELVGV
jgi:predicted glycoside hydrolase/deacetylase ChbG (UPF0249 family)